jgi:hypothetical protein
MISELKKYIDMKLRSCNIINGTIKINFGIQMSIDMKLDLHQEQNLNEI